jgi:hypothetical protein
MGQTAILPPANCPDPAYGPIAPVLDGTTGLPLLALPEGFEYKSYGWTCDPMSDGRAAPSNHAGMAVVHSARQHAAATGAQPRARAL